jgi:CRISPR/Cas system-associated protein endoribonuclease Cas2
MLSQKRGYKMISISTYLGLVVDAKKLINKIANRLLDNKRPNQNQIILLNIKFRYKSAESMLSQKRGYKVNSISTYLGLVVDVDQYYYQQTLAVVLAASLKDLDL